MTKPVTTVSEMFPREWLHPDDIRGRSPLTVTVERAQIEPRFNPRSKREEDRLIVYFYKATRHLICNKTQAFELAEATGTEVFGDWKGHQVRLSHGMAPNHKPTITIGAAPIAPAQPAAQPAEAQEETAQETAQDDEVDEIDDDAAATEDAAAAAATTLWA